MRPAQNLSKSALGELRPMGLHFSQDVDSERMNLLLEDVFEEAPDPERLLQAFRLGLLSPEDDLVAGACVETCADGSAYIWLMAVRQSDRRKEIEKIFLRVIGDWGRSQNLRSIRLKTSARWAEIRSLLLENHWAMTAAELSPQTNEIEEIWQIPLLPSPLGVVVIGASPNGRGSEWISNIRSCPEWWRLEAVVDPDPRTREYWENLQIPAVSEIAEIMSEQVDAAVVAVPPRFAVPVQRICFERGWAVLVEKPLAASLDELLEFQDDLRHGSPSLIVGVQRRSHPSYVALKAFLHGYDVRSLSIAISLGKPPHDSPDGHRADPRQCRGGSLLDLGYHALDLAHFLIEKPIDMVACSLTKDCDLSSDIDSGAEILGRAGNTWVRCQVDRHGKKGEEVCAETIDGVWVANREGVTSPDEAVAYACTGSWAMAERGRLSALAAACLQPEPTTSDLWDHLALFETIERAYGLGSQIGLKGVS